MTETCHSRACDDAVAGTLGTNGYCKDCYNRKKAPWIEPIEYYTPDYVIQYLANELDIEPERLNHG